jgi:hypothetical protein
VSLAALALTLTQNLTLTLTLTIQQAWINGLSEEQLVQQRLPPSTTNLTLTPTLILTI